MSLSNRVAIVTGGASGIGRETCLRFAEEGAHVVCGDMDGQAGAQLEKVWAASPHSQGSITFLKYDACSREDCMKLVKHAVDHFHTVDILFNNVGIQPVRAYVPVHLLDDKDWDLVQTVNVKSHFWMCKEVLPHMMTAQRGVIIGNASVQAIQSQRCVPAYAASKGAVVALSRQLAMDYGQYNIRSVCVSPGSILTPLARANTNLEYMESNTPLGHAGEPRDVADLVVFLASDAAKWITGQNFVVDGGITAKGGWAALSDSPSG